VTENLTKQLVYARLNTQGDAVVRPGHHAYVCNLPPENPPRAFALEHWTSESGHASTHLAR
jgi:hypothetical protein